MDNITLPPLDPKKTASGIIVDPRTLERVIPSSKRKDGSVRKEQKVRAGYVPQEDVGAFRTRRQAQTEASRGVVPGGGGRVGSKAQKPDNPFAQDAAAKSKAQVKNEKRRAKKAEVHHNWDSESDDDGAIEDAFQRLDVNEEAFPALGSSPKKSTPRAIPGASASAGSPKRTSLAGSPIKNAIAAALGSSPTKSPWARRPVGSPPGALPSLAVKDVEPHPIQGGRRGPIGLAHPPPVESSPPKPRTPPSRSDGEWRRGGAAGGGAPRVPGRGGPPGSARSVPGGRSPRDSPAPKEERVRAPVRVREGSGGPLADRVRSILLQSAGDKPRRTASSGGQREV